MNAIQIIQYSLFNKGELINPMSYLTYGLQHNEINNEHKSSKMLVFEGRGNHSTRRKPLGAE